MLTRATTLGFTAAPGSTPEDIAMDISQTTGASVERLDPEEFGRNVFGFRMWGRPVALLCSSISVAQVWSRMTEGMADPPPPPEPRPDEWFIVGQPGFVLGFAMHVPNAVHEGGLHAQLAQALIEELSEPDPEGQTLFAQLPETVLEQIKTVLSQTLGSALADQVMTAFLHGRPKSSPPPGETIVGGQELPPDILAVLESLQMPEGDE